MRSGNTTFLRPASGVFVLLIQTMAATTTAIAAAPPPSPPLVTIPIPPVPPRSLALEDEVNGRHLLFDTLFAYHNPGSVTFDSRWITVSGSPGDVLAPSHSGTESLAVEVDARRLSLVSEEDPRGGGGRTIRRTISDGSNLITTRFEQTAGSSAPSRSFNRLALDEGASIQRALDQIQVSPQTRGSEFVVLPTVSLIPASAVVWRAAAQETIEGGRRGIVVDEIDNRAASNEGGGGQQERFCRYLIDPNSHRLLRFEAWDVDSTRPRPARQYRPKDANGAVVGETVSVPASAATVSYRRELYTSVARGDDAQQQRLPSSLWALTVPPNYKEEPLPTVNLPALAAPPAPGALDPRALAVIRRWREASLRFVAITASVEVLDHNEPRTDISRAPAGRFQDARVHYDVLWRRPAQARVSVHTISGGQRRRFGFGAARDGVAVSDGQRVVAVMDGARQDRPLRDPAPLYSSIVQVGLRDPYNALFYLFNTAPDIQFYDRISFEGHQILEGGLPVDVIALHRVLNANRQGSKADSTIRCFVGQDGMPREIETRSAVSLNGRLERDQPATAIRTVKYQNLLLDSSPPATAFDLP